MINLQSNYLMDQTFLKQLASLSNLETTVRIIALDFQEKPIETIEGKVSDGSIRVSGSSTIRRICSLKLETSLSNINNFVWGLNTKFKLEIGLTNTINNSYPPVVWFPQGVFIITSLSINSNQENITMSIEAKDKMCLLNGDISGHFGQYIRLDAYQDNNNVYHSYSLKKVISDLLLIQGKELAENIIIKDLEKDSLEIVKYSGSSPLYIQEMILNIAPEDPKSLPFQGQRSHQYQVFLPSSLDENDNIVYNDNWQDGATLSLDDKYWNGKLTPTNLLTLPKSHFSEDITKNDTTIIYWNKTQNQFFVLYQIMTNDLAGYRIVPTIYNTKLEFEPDDTVADALKKICRNFGDSFEFFYDVYGRFVFLKKKTFVDTNWSPWTFFFDEKYIETTSTVDEYIYTFDSLQKCNNLSILPGLDKIKNDFIVYGKNKQELPIHLRYAIDNKPVKYTSLESGITYISSLHPEESSSIKDSPHITLPDTIIDEDNTPHEEGDKDPSTPDINPNPDIITETVTKEVSLSPSGQFIYNHNNVQYFSMFQASFLRVENKHLTIGSKIKFYRISLFHLWRDLVAESVVTNIVYMPEIMRYRIYFAPCGLKANAYDIKFAYQIEVTSLNLKKNSKSYSRLSKSMSTQKDLTVLQDITDINKLIEDSIINPLVATNEQVVDWREIIYLMAKDYHKYGNDDDFIFKLTQSNPLTTFNGLTGYEQYYTDILGFWRDVYEVKMTFKCFPLTKGSSLTIDDFRSYLALNSFDVTWTENEFFLHLLKNDSDKLYGFIPINSDFYNLYSTFYIPCYYFTYEEKKDENTGKLIRYWLKHKIHVAQKQSVNSYILTDSSLDTERYVNNTENIRSIYVNPNNSRKFSYNSYLVFSNSLGWKININQLELSHLRYWLDFIEAVDNLSSIGVKTIGDRTLVSKIDGASVLFDPEIPPLIYTDKPQIPNVNLKFSFIQVPSEDLYLTNITLAAYPKSLKSRIDLDISSHISFSRGLSLSCLALYCLEPNRKILLNDLDNNLHGQFILNSFNISLRNNERISLNLSEISYYN